MGREQGSECTESGYHSIALYRALALPLSHVDAYSFDAYSCDAQPFGVFPFGAR